MSRAPDNWPSINATVAPIVAALVEQAAGLRVGVESGPGGARIIDAGIRNAGGIEAGIRIAEICMAGLGRVALVPDHRFRNWSWSLAVHTANPVLACLGSQYAGWSLSGEDATGAFHALGSGPGRALAVKEPLFEEIGYRDRADSACLVLEADRVPPDAVFEKVVRDCRIDPERLTMILTPTKSLAGTVQIVARVLEVALHKVHALGFPLDRIVDGMGSAPLPPPGSDFVAAMGRTNDAILYGGNVHIFVSGDDGSADELARRLPSGASRDYGQPFAETFRAYKGDFFAIDPMLFSPARVVVTAVESGRSFRYGECDEALLDRSFGGTDADE